MKQKYYLLISEGNWKVMKANPKLIEAAEVDYIITTKYCNNNQSYLGVLNDSDFITRSGKAVVWQKAP